MENNKKRFAPLILLMTVVFALVSAYMVYNLFQDNGNDDILNIFKQDETYVKTLEEKLQVDIKSSEAIDVLNELGVEGIIVPKKYDAYYKPCFDFVILKDGIKITRALAKNFYTYDWQVGDIIVSINEQKISEMEYFKVFDLIYSNKLENRNFILANGKAIEYKYEVYQNRLEVIEDDNNLEIKVYDLDVTFAKYINELSTKKEYGKIVIDLSAATINDFNSFRQYLSLFAEGKSVLFNKPEGVKALDTLKMPNCEINIGENQDQGVLFLASCIKKLNANVSIKNVSQNSYLCQTVYEDSNYRIYLKNYQIEAKASSGVEV